MNLDPLFSPACTAVAGSVSEGRLGSVLLRQIQLGGYMGELYAVNPKGQGVHGLPGFPSLQACPTRPDLVVVASPAGTVAGVLEDAGRAGVKAAVIITSGFAETGNHTGESEILETARRWGIRFVGPNCAGIINAHQQFYPTLEVHPPAGRLAVISQSGALGAVLLALAGEQGTGISKFVSYGNGSDIGPAELLEALAEDPLTGLVGLYIESVRDGRHFMHALAACASRKPVLVIKAGRTEAGKRATASHTGSLAGSDTVYTAAFERAGALRVNSAAELMEVCSGFLSLPPVTGSRLVIVTNSGGPGVLAADLAEELGLQVSEPPAEVQEGLRTFLPPHCSLRNPIDITVEAGEDWYERTLQAVLPACDAAIAMNIAPAYLDPMDIARGVSRAAASSGKPVAANFLPAQVVGGSVAYLKEHGLPNFASGEQAVRAIHALSRLPALARRAASLPAQEKLVENLQARQASLPAGGQILEPDAMAWLRRNGIPVPDFQLAASPGEAVETARQIGWPVVLKVVSAGVLHKSDKGGVVTGIHDEAGVRQAFEQVRAAASGADFQGALVYPMLKGGVEVLVGLSRDPQFGPVVVFGLGGIYTEVWKDVSLRLAPVGRDEALGMIAETKAARLLAGARGRLPGDLQALAALVECVSHLPFLYPGLGELDLNPVFVFPEGVCAADVRIIRQP